MKTNVRTRVRVRMSVRERARARARVRMRVRMRVRARARVRMRVRMRVRAGQGGMPWRRLPQHELRGCSPGGPEGGHPMKARMRARGRVEEESW